MSSTGDFEHLYLANGDIAPVRVRIDGRARRISLKVEKIGGLVTLTAPTASALPAARRFMSKRVDWIAQKRASAQQTTPFAAGESIPVFGRLRRIEHDPDARDPVRLDAGRLTVGGSPSGIAAGIGRFIRAEALRRLKTASAAHADKIGAEIAAVSVRDPRTRWGSCSSTGRLSFSWRLAMAPPSVLDYVAAHEVAHLKHMNHGPAFWDLVATLDPAWEAAEAWLTKEGPTLRRYG